MRDELFVDFRKPLEASSSILRALGLWSRSPKIFFGPNLYTAYAVSVLAACNLMYAFEVAYHVLEPSDFKTTVSSGVVVFEKLQTNVKVFCIIRHQPVVKRFLEECNGEVFQPRTKQQAEDAEGVLRVYRWFYVLFQTSAVLSSATMVGYCLVGSHEEAALPYVAWYPFDYTRYYFPTYLHQAVTAVLIALTHVNIDCFSIGLLAFTIAQCGILAGTIRNLKDITKSSLGRKNINHEELLLETEKQLYTCIQHHKEILRWFQEIYSMLNFLIFVQYAASTLTLCMTLIEATLVEPTDPKFTTMVLFEAVMLGQLFLFCWWGNEVISKSSQIPVAIFESDWPEMSPRSRKDLLTFAQFTQRPLELFGADYFRVSLQNFMLILKHSYSFFAVLRHMNSYN